MVDLVGDHSDQNEWIVVVFGVVDVVVRSIIAIGGVIWGTGGIGRVLGRVGDVVGRSIITIGVATWGMGVAGVGRVLGRVGDVVVLTVVTGIH